MLLTYSHERFPLLITNGVKIHTIREDKHQRWKPGMKIHHWMYNPRHTFRNPYPFLQDRGDVLVSKQKIDVEPLIKMIRIDGDHFLNDQQMDELAFNDGLENTRVLFTWFKESFSGWILHWTDKRY